MTETRKDILSRAGDAFIPVFITDRLNKLLYKSPNYTFYIQGWTFLHFFTGIIIGFLYLYMRYDKKYYFLSMFIIHTLWEIWQVIVGIAKPWNISGRNSIIDSTMDTIMFMFGSYLLFLYKS
jgi:hypothetical protein